MIENRDKAKETTTEQYNAEPVFYCGNCLSLKIRGEIEGFEYCDDCGSTYILTASIEEWEKMYVEKTGHKFLDSDY